MGCSKDSLKEKFIAIWKHASRNKRTLKQASISSKRIRKRTKPEVSKKVGKNKDQRENN